MIETQSDRAARIEQIRRARQAVCSEPTPLRAGWLADAGWSVERYEWLRSLPCPPFEWVGTWPWIEWLVGSAEGAAIAGADAGMVDPWLRVLAAAPDPRAVESLGDAIGHWDGMVLWWIGIPAAVAAAAWAAGLKPKEVRAQMAARALDLDALRTLAVLRGYLLDAELLADAEGSADVVR